jgi:hypothetical protein
MYRAARQRYEARNPDRNRRRVLRRYGMTLAEYDRRLADQGGVCLLCQRAPGEGTVLAVDHCHASGRVRALLCPECNSAVGLLEATGADPLAWAARALVLLAVGRQNGNGRPVLAAPVVSSRPDGPNSAC